MKKVKRPPLWGNFLAHADEDLLASALLIHDGFVGLGCYHGSQAVEKYLKALVLATLDPDGTTETPATQPWLRTHDLLKLASACVTKYPKYAAPNVQDELNRISEFDQAARYPWVRMEHSNGFSSGDFKGISNLCKLIRNDLPISRDDYLLGCLVRGYMHGNKNEIVDLTRYRVALTALRSLELDLDAFVRGWQQE